MKVDRKRGERGSKFGLNRQRWSRGHKARGQGHKKIRGQGHKKIRGQGQPL